MCQRAKANEVPRCRDDQIVAEARVEAADLDLPVLDQQPQPRHPPAASGELQPDHHPLVRQQVAADVGLGPRPQDNIRVGVLPGQLGPALGPAPDGLQDPGQVLAGRGTSARTATRARSDLGRISSTQARSSSRSRRASRARDRPGAPAAISLNVRQPSSRLRRMIGVQTLGEDLRAPGRSGRTGRRCAWGAVSTPRARPHCLLQIVNLADGLRGSQTVLGATGRGRQTITGEGQTDQPEEDRPSNRQRVVEAVTGVQEGERRPAAGAGPGHRSPSGGWTWPRGVARPCWRAGTARR